MIRVTEALKDKAWPIMFQGRSLKESLDAAGDGFPDELVELVEPGGS